MTSEIESERSQAPAQHGDLNPAAPLGAEDASDAEIAELLRRYHRVEAAHGPPRLVWAGRVLWRREQFIELLAGLNGDAPAALQQLSAQLAEEERRAWGRGALPDPDGRTPERTGGRAGWWRW